MATRHAETFAKKFKPVLDKDGEVALTNVYTLGDNLNTLWTLIDPMVPSGQQYWVPGYHYVNRVGYARTEVPWTDADLADEYRKW